MTTSANIAGTPQPFAMTGSGTRPWPYGAARVYSVADMKPGKKRKKKDQGYGTVGMLYVGKIGEMTEVYTEPVGNPKDNLWKIPKLGKIGVWRTVRGRRHFFPVDGSGPIPKIPGAKKKGASGKNLYAKMSGDKPKKKGGILGKILSKVTGMLGGGGGAKAGLKDAKPKAAKSKPKAGSGAQKGKKETIPNRNGMLKDVESMMLQARRSKGGSGVASALKKMQKALQSDDGDAFKDAESSLARATQKLAKKRGG